MKMKTKTTLLLCLLLLATLPAAARKYPRSYPFGKYITWMSFEYKGLSLDAYKKHAAALGLNLIHHSEENSEIYLVWGQDLTYKKGRMTESYTATGPRTRCLNLDLTPTGKGKYSPIGITLVFPDKEAQQQYWNLAQGYSCTVCEQMEDTDIDASWSEVSCLRYNMIPGKLLTWHYIYFYVKDGLYMCTFLF